MRQSGVMVVGSGTVVHNLGGMDPRHADSGFDWAQRFDEAARDVITSTPDALPSVQGSRDFDAAVPTPDHFIPLLYLLSMTAYTLGLP